MNQDLKIRSETMKLISLGSDSFERGDDEHCLNTYNVLNDGLKRISEGDPIKGDYTFKCLSLFRVIVKLHKKIIGSININKIPDIYIPASVINYLLVKSAENAISSEDKSHITEQYEVLLSVANIIKYKEDIRRLGILDAKLKNAIGELRSKADIISVFMDEDCEIFDNLIEEVEKILKDGDLEQIGITLLKLESIAEELNNKYITSLNFLNYLKSYKDNYIDLVRKKIDYYTTSLNFTTIYAKQELIEHYTLLEDMGVYHQDNNITSRIKKLKQKIKNSIIPFEKKLKETIEFIATLYNNPSWLEYQKIYNQKYDETDIFTATFYDYTLKRLSSEKAAELLQKKIKNLKQLDLEKLCYITFEENLIKLLTSLIKAFTNPAVNIIKKK